MLIRVIRGCFYFFLICGVFAATPLRADRIYTLGVDIDFAAGMSDHIAQGGFNLGSIERGLTPNFSIYPSIQFKSKGPYSLFDINYTFSVERFRSSVPITTTANILAGSFNTRIGSRTNFRISDTFNTSPEYSTLNVLKGINVTQEGFEYVYEPRVYRKNSFSNNGSIGLDINLTPKSQLHFTGSVGIRQYGETVVPDALSDQFRITGGMGYSYRTSDRQQWKIDYTFRRNEYDLYEPYHTHTTTLGFSRQLTKNASFNAAAGPSFSQNQGSADYYFSYYLTAGISWRLSDNFFNAGYTRSPSDSTGLGPSTNSHRGSLGFSRQLGRNVSLSLQASAFSQQQQQQLTDIYNYWGVNGSGALSYSIGKHWSLTAGGSYMTYIGQSNSLYNNTNRRFYGSVRFALPELWRGER